MEEVNRLLSLMVAHHGLIETLLVVFKDSLSQPVEAKKNFANFKWQVEKHFFVEEKIPFRFIFSEEEQLYELVKKLLEEHSQLLGMIGRVEMQLEKGEAVDMLGLQDLLTKHRKIEEQSLYPKLADMLSQEQRGLIIKRINEIALSQ